MQYRRRLRSRIILSFLLFGIGLTGLFAGITLVMRELLEEELIVTTLRREVDNFVDFKRANPDPDALGPAIKAMSLIVSGGNPVVAFPDQARTEEALDALELLVVIDPRMTPTARRAHYVIAPRLELERAGQRRVLHRCY